MDQIGKSTGELLRFIMEKRNMNIAEVAEWSGMHSSVIEKLLLNQIPMTNELAYRLNMATGIAMSVWTQKR